MTPSVALAGTVLHVGSRVLPTRHGDFVLHVCRDLGRRTFLLALECGDVRSAAPVLARVHSSCVTSETYAGCDCDCSEQLDAGIAAIAAAGRGVIFYLDQEGRGAGFFAKVRDRMLVQASNGALGTYDAYAAMGLAGDLRSYEAVGAARTLLGITAPLTVLTNNPEKLATLGTVGVPIAGSVGLALPPSPFNRDYLAAKAEAGHRLPVGAGTDARPPGPVETVAPHALPEHASLVCIGAYWLPVRARDGGDPAPHWFRLHAYADLATGHERVVLVYGDPSATPALVRLQREALLERLPGREPGRETRRWAATIRAFAAHGAGVAVMLADESRATAEPADAASHAGAAAEATVALARRHLAGRIGIPLRAESEAAPTLAGVALGEARTLPVA